MSIFGFHICMDEIRAAWPIALFVAPTFALVRGYFRTKCKEKNHVR
jgi:hypothetical protein